MPIQKLIIQNFQAIAKTKLDLSPNLNVIFGENGMGKSILIRALRWVYRDAFRGTWFAKTGEERCRVGIQLSSDLMVIRDIERSLDDSGATKVLKVNRYIIKRRGLEDVEFNKFKDLPPDVQEVLDISPALILGKTSDEIIDLNFAHQQNDAVFLMNKPKSLSARLLSHVVGVDPVYKAMRELAREQRADQQEIGRLGDQAEELQTEIAAFPEQQLRMIFAKLESQVSALRDLNTHIETVTFLGDDLERINQEGRTAVSEVKACKNALENLPWQEAEQLCTLLVNLEAGYEEYKTKSTALEQAELSQSSCTVAFDTVNSFLDDWEQVVPLMQSWASAYNDEATLVIHLETLCVAKNDAYTEYQKLLSELGLCPTCGADKEHWNLQGDM